MVFSSAIFLFVFLPLVLTAYLVVPSQWRGLLLLVASLLFYAWGEMLYVGVLLTYIIANYLFGIWLEKAQGDRYRWCVLVAAVGANLALLIAFKYANFLVDNVNVLLGWQGAAPIVLAPVHLPLGISFFTFQALGYVVDVYRREVKAQYSLTTFAFYKTFFPQLVAGPIVRYAEVADMLERPVVTLEGFSYGVTRFAIGLSKKMIVANTLGAVADRVFNQVPTGDLTAGLAWLAMICYTLQIYFDFSGYSDMAIGLAALFGIRFPENFDYPYTATSIQDFWRRWHISLSSFFRDYVYIPLGGSRGGTLRTCFNLLVVFFLCGLWHGASWNFVIWGLFHGAFLTAERFGLSNLLARVPGPVRHAYTLLVVMCGWVFFRANTLPQALAYLGAMLGLGAGSGQVHHVDFYATPETWLVLAIACLAATPIVPWGRARLDDLPPVTAGWGAALLRGTTTLAGSVATLGLLFVSVTKVMSGGHNPFIYFRF